MPIIVNQISSPLNATEQEVISTTLKKLGSASKHAIDCEIHKSSLDARKRNDIHFVHSVFVTLDSADLEKKLCEKNTSLTYVERSVYKPVLSTEKAEGKVVIAGFGPAGMFAGLALAEQGYRPIILERGSSMENVLHRYRNSGSQASLTPIATCNSVKVVQAHFLTASLPHE